MFRLGGIGGQLKREGRSAFHLFGLSCSLLLFCPALFCIQYCCILLSSVLFCFVLAQSCPSNNIASSDQKYGKCTTFDIRDLVEQCAMLPSKNYSYNRSNSNSVHCLGGWVLVVLPIGKVMEGVILENVVFEFLQVIH